MRTFGDRTPVVTGMGLVTPIGEGTTAFWDALMAGRSGVAPVRAFDTAMFEVKIACEVDSAAVDDLAREHPMVGRAALLATVAGREALRELPDHDRRATGLCIGTTMGEACWLESWSPEAVRAGPSAVPAAELLRSGPDQLGLDCARLLGLGGPITVMAAACAAGNYAIARAADLIRLGRSERVLAGGTDAFSRVAFTGFARLGALASEACRPFSADRDGIVIAEGAAFLLIEALGAARARNAEILAVVAGSGLSCDAHHIVSPHPDGAGALRAMRMALKDAGRSAHELDWICAHGTGTRANDRSEVRAARALCGDQVVPMSSIKALTGHSLGAASAIEAVACIQALRYQQIPPTWNHRVDDPECPWDVVPNQPRLADLRLVLNNAYAFGGNNASVLFAHAEDATA